MVIALLRKKRCFVANVGDSRAYRLRACRFRQITQDHSVVSELIERGHITPEEAPDHAASGQLTRYIGMEEKVRSHVRSFALERGDRILLCTDGLTRHVSDEEIERELRQLSSTRSSCEALLNLALDRGGEDNITIVMGCLRRSG